MNTVDAVMAFSQAFGQEWYETPTLPSERTALLRLQLISEEAGELVHALAAQDPVETLDALIDLQYVIDGTYGAYGVAHLYECEQPYVDLSMAPKWGDLDHYSLLDTVGNLHQAISRLSWALSTCHQDGNIEGPNEVYAAGALNELNGVLQAAIWDLGFYAIREVAFFEVHNSNLSKLGEDGKPILNEAGRVVKGPNYRKPDLKKVWEEHCERAAA